MYKQAVISVSKICNCNSAHLPMVARPAINPFNIEPSLPTKLRKSSCSKQPPLVSLQNSCFRTRTTKLRSQPTSLQWRPQAKTLYFWQLGARSEEDSAVSDLLWRNGPSGPLPDTGFECLTVLPIFLVPFRFLKSLDLSSSGLRLGCVPLCFDWQLIEWKPLTQQSRVEIGGTFTEIFKDVEDVHEIVNVRDDTSEEGKGDLETGNDVPVHGIGSGDFILEVYRGDSFENAKGN